GALWSTSRAQATELMWKHLNLKTEAQGWPDCTKFHAETPEDLQTLADRIVVKLRAIGPSLRFSFQVQVFPHQLGRLRA
ncbi:MAG: hypothetical protein AAFX00_13625, partial [Pseudomonadota bacterium]